MKRLYPIYSVVVFLLAIACGACQSQAKKDALTKVSIIGDKWMKSPTLVLLQGDC